MQDVPPLDAFERSFWIFDDIDHNTGRPDGLRPDYAPYAVHDPRHINQIEKLVEEIRKTVRCADEYMNSQGQHNWATEKLSRLEQFCKSVDTAIASYRQ